MASGRGFCAHTRKPTSCIKTHQLHHVGKAVCGFCASHAGVSLNSTPTCLNSAIEGIGNLDIKDAPQIAARCTAQKRYGLIVQQSRDMLGQARHQKRDLPLRPPVATFRCDLPFLTNEMLVHGVRIHTKAGAQPGALFQRNFSPGLRHRHHPPEQRNNAPILLEPLFIHDQNIMDRIRDCV